MPPIYRLDDLLTHHAEVALEDGLRLTTAPLQWAYAVELPLRQRPETPMRTRLEIQVTEGAIGVGTLLGDRNEFFHEIEVPTTAEPVLIDVLTGAGDQAGAMILRNVDGLSRPGTARLRILETVPQVAEEPLLTPPDDIGPELEIDISPLKPFKSWKGQVPGGFWPDWTGALTNMEVSVQDERNSAIYSQDRIEDPGIPMHPEHLLDWLPMCQAINAADGVFRMAALGAGWGRWLVSGALLARQIGKDYRLLAVEAEPQHYAWLNEHIDTNAIDRTKTTLLHAAATGKPGDCWFDVGGDPQDWYGQSVHAVDGPQDGDIIAGPNGPLRRTASVTMADLVSRLTPIDYLHMDIQGAEGEFLSAAPHLLDEHVKMVNVGTHSMLIERDLRALFGGLGWTNLHDVQLFSAHPIRIDGRLSEPVKFTDGVQVWINPRFAHDWRS